MNEMRCTLAPRGWFCTRQAKHPGPCAAYPEVEREPLMCPDCGSLVMDEDLHSDWHVKLHVRIANSIHREMVSERALTLGEARTRLTQENVDLREWLAKYGDHLAECSHYATGHGCTCGWGPTWRSARLTGVRNP